MLERIKPKQRINLLGQADTSNMRYQKGFARRVFIFSQYSFGWRGNKKWFYALLAIMNMFIFNDIAYAQDIPRNIGSPIGRNSEPSGFKSGRIIVYPSVVSGVLYDSNIFDREISVVDDVISYVAPKVSVLKKTKKSDINFKVDALFAKFIHEDSQSFENVSGEFTHKYRFKPRAELVTHARIEHLNEIQTSTNDDLPTNAAGPVVLNSFEAGVELNIIKNKYVGVAYGFIYANDNYEDVRLIAGGIADQDFRDQEEFTFEKAVKVDFSKHLKSHTKGLVRFVNGRDTPNVIDRDVTVYELEAGITVAYSERFYAEFTLNLLKEDFHSARVIDAGVLPGYHASLFWQPRHYLTLRVGVHTEETGVDFEEGGASSISDSIDGEIKYLINKNLVLNGKASYIEDEFVGTGRTVKSTDVEISTLYAINRYLGLSLVYTYNKRHSNAALDSFERNAVQASIISRF